jgi:hypothetical protein
VPVRRSADDAPGVGVLDPAGGAEGLPGGAAALRDRPALAVGGVHQEEPELGIGQVQRDDRGNSVRVVGRVRHHHAQRPAHRGTLACRFHGADFDVVLIERKNSRPAGKP